jgi:hypothetical protein
LEDNDVDSVVNMMEQHDFDVDNAISEYNPQTHKVMSREDKWGKENKKDNKAKAGAGAGKDKSNKDKKGADKKNKKKGKKSDEDDDSDDDESD